MEIEFNNLKEVEDIIYNVLNQGDSRYNNSYDEEILSYFLINKAIILEEKIMPFIFKPEEKEFLLTKGVQKKEKYIAIVLLKEKGFQDNEILFEKKILDYVVDILVKKGNLLLPIECCSCKISKIIGYLTKVEEMWVITRGDAPWEDSTFNERIQWFIFKRGPKWKKFIGAEKEKDLEKLKKVSSPLDSL